MIRDGSPAVDARVSEITWPPEATLVSIRRQQNVLIPRGDTLIRMGDELTIYCDVEDRAAVRTLLQAPIKDPG
jgi:Trk K+ transport system NAD-binding subunit